MNDEPRLWIRSLRTLSGGGLILLTMLGCTSRINSWRLPSYVDKFSPTDGLCSFRGKVVAIVPGKGFDDQVKPRSHDFRSALPNWRFVTATGDLTITIDGGSPVTFPGGADLDPELVSGSAAILRRMGFNVVDRQHVAAVLEEQDIRAVYAHDVQRVGRLLGADVLVLTSVLKSPVVYFAAGGAGDWALQLDYHLRGHEVYVGVADSAYLGHYTASGSVLAACGVSYVEAKRRVGLLQATVGFQLHSQGGALEPAGLDMTTVAYERNRDLEARVLQEWTSLCEEVDRIGRTQN